MTSEGDRATTAHGDTKARVSVRASADFAILGRWVLSCTVGELLGFGATALLALGMIAWLGRPTTLLGRVVALVVMTLAGTIEGASLGSFQWRVLRGLWPRLAARAWVSATIAVAAAGWFLGMLPPLIVHALGLAPAAPQASVATGETARPSILLFLALAAVFGAVAGTLFGVAQWLVLRRHTPRAGRWIAANALGWALGLPWAYAAGRLGSGATKPVASVALALVGAVGMGASMALVTGLCVLQLVHSGRDTRSAGTRV